jgi:phosphonate transport system substrate-binding protein
MPVPDRASLRSDAPVSTDPSATLRAQDFAREVGRALGAVAEVHVAADYRGLVAALSEGMVHVAWVPSYTAGRSVIAGRIRPVALSVRNGATTYAAGLITHRASAIQSPADLRGVRAAWVDRESASGYAVIRRALRARGVPLVDAFKEEQFARSHAEVARLVASRRVDVGATFVNYLPDGHTVMRGGWMGVDGVNAADIRIVTSAGPIPCDFIAVNGKLSRVLAEEFTTILVDGRHGGGLNRAAKALLSVDGFVRTSHEHVTMLEELLEQLESPNAQRVAAPPSSKGRR